MNKINLILEELKIKMDDMEFGEVILEARERIGMRQYRAAEMMGMTIGRLKRLETGFFKAMPSATEIREICELFGLPKDKMIEKAELHCARLNKPTKADRYFNG